MAGDWIPRQKGLNRKAEVLAIAKATGLHRRFVADTLMEFWEWCDAELTDGLARGLSLSELPGLIPETDERFWQVVAEVGWLRVTASGLTIPHWERWLGRSAKNRLKATERQRLSRSERDKNVTPVLSCSVSSEERNGGSGEGEGTDGPGPGMPWPPWLTREWLFYYAGVPGKASDARYLTGKLFPELCRLFAPEAIRGGIRAKERPKTQPPWEFEKWLRERAPPKSAAPSAAERHAASQAHLDRLRRGSGTVGEEVK